ncbi:MAG: AAC(3) family N-acetyltransferase [Candidatus Thorarchaeota archaeon]|nr:MAG: AAC(3) family N-acetyltransferase [Candidatus Thorarchaeota archaeon]
MTEHWENEGQIVEATEEPIMRKSLVEDFRKAGIYPGDTIIVHSSMRTIGWIIGGSVTVIEALMEAVSDQGTLVMPTQSTDNGEPSRWRHPPVPEGWWQLIRDETPPYNPETTPTRKMGIIAETFRKYPNVYRSAHPQASFGAWGKNAEYVVESHPLDDVFGENSPLAKLYELNTKILLIGIGLEANTCLHHAEAKANLPGMPMETKGASVLEEGKRVWKVWDEPEYNDDDFHMIAADFEMKEGLSPVYIGQAESHIFSMRALVDYAVEWLRKNRHYPKVESN